MAWREQADIGHLQVDRVDVVGVERTIGAEDDNVIAVSLQLKESVSGKNLKAIHALDYYFASSATTLAPHATGVDAIAATTGSIVKSGGDSLIAGKLITSATGAAVLSLTHVGAETVYLVLCLPGGRTWVSPAITFDATT
jgi:hypothetical protein